MNNSLQKQSLTRAQMKQITGGAEQNPNCNGVGTYDWYCRKDGACTHIGEMSCNDASAKCSGGTITNSTTC